MRSAAASESDSLLVLTETEAVLPLDAQVGAGIKKSVPDGLWPALFGQPDPAPDAQSPLMTYAVLDAAKIPLLHDRLQEAGLPYCCLFDGRAYAQMHSVAPYVVQLDPAHKLTRQLFTKSGQASDLWGHEAGIFVRAHRPLDDVRRHFRRLVRMQDDAGKWYYFRFWEPQIAQAFWAAFPDDAAEVAWRYGAVIASVTYQDGDRFVQIAAPYPTETQPVRQGALARYRSLFAQARWDQFTRRVHDALQTTQNPGYTTDPAMVARLCDMMRNAGYLREAAIWNMVQAALICDRHGLDLPALTQQTLDAARRPDDVAAARAVLARVRKISGEEAL